MELNAAVEVRAIAVPAIAWTDGKVTAANVRPVMSPASLLAAKKYALVTDTATVGIAGSLSPFSERREWFLKLVVKERYNYYNTSRIQISRSE